ncbi:hypothetical protein NX059_012421 [Plenodomus lindquistii]|nr:hypothetical protein NX059_012421 [Plenodomus lindquistii]
MHATPKLSQELQAHISACLAQEGVKGDISFANISRVAGQLETLRLSHWKLSPDKFMATFGCITIVNRRFVSKLTKLCEAFQQLPWEEVFAQLSAHRNPNAPWSERVITSTWADLDASSEPLSEFAHTLHHKGKEHANSTIVETEHSQSKRRNIASVSKFRPRALAHRSDPTSKSLEPTSGSTESQHVAIRAELRKFPDSAADEMVVVDGAEHKAGSPVMEDELHSTSSITVRSRSLVRRAPSPETVQSLHNAPELPTGETSLCAMSDVASINPVPEGNACQSTIASKADTLSTKEHIRSGFVNGSTDDLGHGKHFSSNIELQKQCTSTTSVPKPRSLDAETAAMIERLTPGRCLNHSTVMCLLQELLPQVRCTLHDPGSIPENLMVGTNEAVLTQLKRWEPRSLRRDPEDASKPILVPVLVPAPSGVGHWVLCVVHPQHAAVVIYDSMSQKLALEDKMVCAGQLIAKATRVQNAKISFQPRLPQQKNAFDCGIFTMAYALTLAVGKHPGRDIKFDPLALRTVLSMHLGVPNSASNASSQEVGGLRAVTMWHNLHEVRGEAKPTLEEQTDEETGQRLGQVQRFLRTDREHLQHLRSLANLLTTEAEEAALVTNRRLDQHAALTTHIVAFINTTLGGAKGTLKWDALYHDPLQQMRTSAEAAMSARNSRVLKRSSQRASIVVDHTRRLKAEMIRADELLGGLASEVDMRISQLKARTKQVAETDEQ